MNQGRIQRDPRRLSVVDIPPLHGRGLPGQVRYLIIRACGRPAHFLSGLAAVPRLEYSSSAASMSPSILVLVLNWNRWLDTVECLESVFRIDYPRYRVIVCDNGSSDGSREHLKAWAEGRLDGSVRWHDSRSLLSEFSFPPIPKPITLVEYDRFQAEAGGNPRDQGARLILIQTGANLGYAGGNNVGLRYALARQDSEYVWLLNNDTVVAPDALTELVRTAETDDSIGMVGSKIVYFENPRLLWYAGANLDSNAPWRMHHRGLQKEDTGQYDKVEETGFVTGCSLLARAKMLSEIGLLDESFFLYFEDSDLCVRAGSAGWKLVYCPDSVIQHKVSLSMGGAGSPAMQYYYSRNFLYFVKKHFPDKLMRTLLHDIFEHILVNLKKGKVVCAAMAIQGIWHYFTGRHGSL